MPVFNDFCRNKKCPEYIEWTFEMGANCTSCKLVGQSYDITEYPKDCLFLDEIKKFESGAILADEVCYHLPQDRVKTHKGYHCGNCGKRLKF